MMTEFKLDTIDPTPPVNFCQPLAKISKVALNTCLEPDDFVWSDPLRVQQVLINVISNAIKHARLEGCIMIPSALASKARVKKLLDEALVAGNNPENRKQVHDGRILVISFPDSGAGIPESTNEIIPDVFST
jgi:signal transduction histidine kinase